MDKRDAKIEKLIIQLCPNGVERKAFGEVATIVRGASPRPIHSFLTEARNGIPWIKIGDIAPGEKYITGTAEHVTAAGAENSRRVYPGDFVLSNSMSFGRPYISKIEGCIHDGWLSISNFNAALIPDFLYHLLRSAPIQTEFARRAGAGTVKNLNADIVKSVRIPVPPLRVQEEIARTLDNFTKLEAELEAELEARRKQYEYYREELLTFEKGVEFKALGEVGTLIRGSGLQKNDFIEDGVGCIHYGQIYTYYGTYTDKTKSFVSQELAKSLKKVNKGDLVITSTSENIEDVCKAVAWLGEDEIVTGGHATILKHNENPKYLSYYFRTASFSNQKRKYAKGTKVIDVCAKDLAKIRVPIPTLAEQERIVGVLDRFDALVNDISIGLPAELNARRKQYEYYRDKLLTFAPLK